MSKIAREIAEDIVSRHVGEAHDYAVEQGTAALYEMSGYTKAVQEISDGTEIIIDRHLAGREAKVKELLKKANLARKLLKSASAGIRARTDVADELQVAIEGVTS